MAGQSSTLLQNLLDRLLAGLLSGPALNCRPHGSRQRLDLMTLAKLDDVHPASILRSLLGEEGKAKLSAKVQQVAGSPRPSRDTDIDVTEIDDPRKRKWNEQYAVLSKLRSIAQDAATYEQDTGVHVLSIGYPLLHIPAGQGGSRRRILAPLAFIPVSLAIKGAATKSVELVRVGEGADLIQPNVALLAWLEQMKVDELPVLDPDHEGSNPWGEIVSMMKGVLRALQLKMPDIFTSEKLPEILPLVVSPKQDGEEQAGVIPSAVIGLYPMANQGLIRDLRALNAGEAFSGPIEAFVKAGVALADDPAASELRERLVAEADPCQARAVRLARRCRGLVVHGPPGTGKSQTITNIIGDHLARGERVLFVSDKRTALDVVYNRLEHLGLGQLCAVIHDPQRDQRDLYKSIRSQLDGLTDIRTQSGADARLLKVEREIATLYNELENYRSAVMDTPAKGGLSLHELIGQWLELPDSPVTLPNSATEGTLDELEESQRTLTELLKRAIAARWADHPWRLATTISLTELLKISPADLRRVVDHASEAAVAVDATREESIPPYDPNQPLVGEAGQGRRRSELLVKLRSAMSATAEIRAHWHDKDVVSIRRGLQQLDQARPLLGKLRDGPLDAELGAAARGQLPIIAAIGQQTAALDEYLAVARKWYAFLSFGKKKAAAAVITPYGLPVSATNAERVRGFLQDLRGRMVLSQLYHDVASKPPVVPLVPDNELERSMGGHAEVLGLLSWLLEHSTLRMLEADVRRALVDEAQAKRLIQGLEASESRAVAIEDAMIAFQAVPPLAKEWISSALKRLCAGDEIMQSIKMLRERLPTLEEVVRVRESLDTLPKSLSTAARAMANASLDVDVAMAAIHKGVLTGEIRRRFEAHPQLHTDDDRKLSESFARYQSLAMESRRLTRDALIHLWVTRQKSRLLAMTGTRLNTTGAELRRRFMLQGEKAMRLRKVIEIGRSKEIATDGDPLFDLRPVWMASPETVAQLFPREPIFDLVVFDEASQCRLEEAVPVLTRAKRVVVAGDPRQLPPSRFFEAATVTSGDQDAETDQELFESQQSDTEDLLSAALNLEIQEAYLDVHYRSRNADLIEFSNEHFYGRRLQAIPAHPKNRTRYAPLSLHAVNGTYCEGLNEKEAEYICKIVRDLLRRAEPPSIGIACFNVNQRDLILDMLDDAASADGEFARRLEAARRRVGRGSFEGLFVKNLENVQGDERDHIIISTTYGPDSQGKFYRRFGPLGRAGGGRRLNVLVTRARDEVHLVTSIPRDVYRSLPPILEGQVPAGGWLLFAYLKYAEDLANLYALSHKHSEASENLDESKQDVMEIGAASAETQPSTHITAEPRVTIRAATPPSPFASALARTLAAHRGHASTVHWGNDGFSIDIALAHPTKPHNVTLGLLTDFARYRAADDLIEWDLFRTAIHESQGWTLRRLWSPHFYRDPTAHLDDIGKQLQLYLEQEPPDEELRVQFPS